MTLNNSIIKGMICALTFVCTCTNAFAEVQASEPELKAAIITNILSYVEWPPPVNATEQLVICYIDKNNVAEALIKLEGKTLKTKTLKIIQATASFESCHAVYMASATITGPKLIELSKANAILIAGDSTESIKPGIMLNLEIVEGKAVFDINLGLVKKVGLQISSKVLKLARKIIE